MIDYEKEVTDALSKARWAFAKFCIAAIVGIAVLLWYALIGFSQETVPVEVHYPAMLVHRIRFGEWLNAKEPSTARVEMPDRAIDFSGFIPPTYVRGVVRRVVDPCTMWVHSDQMDQLHLNLPAEPVVGRVALAITATGTLTLHTGEEYPVTVRIPACRTRMIDLRTREAEAVTATGLVLLRRRP